MICWSRAILEKGLFGDFVESQNVTLPLSALSARAAALGRVGLVWEDQGSRLVPSNEALENAVASELSP